MYIYQACQMGGKASPDAAQVSDEHKKAEKERTEAHIKTLDDLVSVNSLFTLAVFVGLSQASPGAISLENRQECNAGPGIRIGLYSCGSAEARRAIWALGTIVAIALVIYVLALIIAIYASITTDGQYSVSSKTNSDEKRGDNQKDESSGLIEGRSAV
ncbi:hypothetical protein ACET3Z_008665 [Daucus carota]